MSQNLSSSRRRSSTTPRRRWRRALTSTSGVRLATSWPASVKCEERGRQSRKLRGQCRGIGEARRAPAIITRKPAARHRAGGILSHRRRPSTKSSRASTSFAADICVAQRKPSTIIANRPMRRHRRRPNKAVSEREPNRRAGISQHRASIEYRRMKSASARMTKNAAWRPSRRRKRANSLGKRRGAPRNSLSRGAFANRCAIDRIGAATRDRTCLKCLIVAQR